MKTTNKKNNNSKKTTKKTAVAKRNPLVYVVVAIVVFIITFIVGANLIIIRNDCDSPCRWEEGDELMACPAVCVKTEQTLWEKITGKNPRVIGY